MDGTLIIDNRTLSRTEDPLEITKALFGCYTGFLCQDSGACLSHYSRDFSSSYDSSPLSGVSPSTMSDVEEASEHLFEGNENLELIKTSFASLLSYSPTPTSQYYEETCSDESSAFDGFDSSKGYETPSSPETYCDLDKCERTQILFPPNTLDHTYILAPEADWRNPHLDEFPHEPEPQCIPAHGSSVSVPPHSNSDGFLEKRMVSGECDSQVLQDVRHTTSKSTYHLRDRPRHNRLKRENSREAMGSVLNMDGDFLEFGGESFPELSHRLKTMDTRVDPCSKVKTTNRNRDRGPKSWEFLARLLIDSSTNPSIICWEEPETYTFRVVNQNAVAQKWGERSNKPVSYENFARGLRYHYGRGGLRAVPTKKLVYSFGEKGIRFIRDYYSDLELKG